MNIRLQNKETIGSGAYGIIYKGKDAGGKTYVVKRSKSHKSIDFISSLREIDLLTELKGHPYIVDMKCIIRHNPFSQQAESEQPLSPIESRFRSDENLIIMEECTTDLHNMIYAPARSSWYKFKLIMFQILIAIEYIHYRNIIHRDLKPSNILWCEKTNQIKICDFGICLRNYNQKMDNSTCQTAWYKAPEIASGDRYNTKAMDMWSIGCIFFEIVTGRAFMKVEDDAILIRTILTRYGSEKSKRFIKDYNIYDEDRYPKEGKSMAQLLNLTREQIENFNSKPQELPFGHPLGTYSEFIDLMSSLLAIHPKDRISASEALKSDFFKCFSELGRKVRNSHPTYTPPPDTLSIIKCNERKYVTNILCGLFNKSTEFSPVNSFVVFHALEIFDRYMLYVRAIARQNETSSRRSATDRCYSQSLTTPCTSSAPAINNTYEFYTFDKDYYDNLKYIVSVILYMCVKYFSEECMGQVYSYANIVKTTVSDTQHEKAKDFEFFLLTEVLKLKLFNITPLECLLEKLSPDLPYQTYKKEHSLLLITYCHLKSSTYLPEEIYNHYIKFSKHTSQMKLSLQCIKDYFDSL